MDIGDALIAKGVTTMQGLRAVGTESKFDAIEQWPVIREALHKEALQSRVNYVATEGQSTFQSQNGAITCKPDRLCWMTRIAGDAVVHCDHAGNPYSAMLVTGNPQSSDRREYRGFYLIQLLVREPLKDGTKRFQIWERSGKQYTVGTPWLGDDLSSEEAAVSAFKDTFKHVSGTQWLDASQRSFPEARADPHQPSYRMASFFLSRAAFPRQR